jgi:sporulation protein YlmC with PRC-barrel domain
VELSDQPFALSDLIGRPVRDASGRKLGRVFEVRGHREGEGIVVDEILVGPRALLKRLRGPDAKARPIPWAQIREVGEGIVITGPDG